MSADFLYDLRRGIDRDEIVPYFQPLVELRTGQLSGFEVLARWRHPERGMISPDQFIWVAEESGLIGNLTESLLEQSFRAAASLPEHLTLAVNISAIQLRGQSLPMQIGGAAERAGLSLDRVTVEITESALVANLEQARSITEELKAMGVRLALDDFGTGYSSLRHLHALTFDQIKVDRSFVQSMLTRRDSRKIVAAIVGLGQSLGLLTVAEGVENKAEAEMLVWLGCDVGQGWLYGEPTPARDLPRVVAAHRALERNRQPIAMTSADMAFHVASLPTQRHSQLQAIYDAAPVGLGFLDSNLRYVSLNCRLAEMNNVPIVAHLGRTVQEVLPDIFPRLEPYLRRALAGESISGVEMDFHSGTRVGGRKLSTLVSYQPARDEAGEVVGIAVSVIDITERANAEEALKESREHHQSWMTLNPQVSWTADPEGRILDASPLWEALTGLTLDETVNDGWVKALHPDDVAPTEEAWMESVRKGVPIDVEFRIWDTNDRYRWVRSRAFPRRNDKGEIIRWYGMLEDVDEHKRTLVELEESREQLRKLMEETKSAGGKRR
jgi:PAS domain S-box-containing protein